MNKMMKLKQLLFLVMLTALVPATAKEIKHTEKTEEIEQKQESNFQKIKIVGEKIKIYFWGIAPMLMTKAILNIEVVVRVLVGIIVFGEMLYITSEKQVRGKI